MDGIGDRQGMNAPLAARVAGLDWCGLEAQLDDRGYATTGPLLTPQECASLTDLYPRAQCFRSTVVMERHAYGRGEYRYFAYPLPELVQRLRTSLYPRLVPTARRWARDMRVDAGYPDALEDFLEICRAEGQTKPTPLILRYEAEGYNCLHQDRYGAVAFPLQVVLLLSDAGRDFTGGELLLVEQRPRAQSRGEAVTLGQGEAVIFANAQRPVKGARGHYRVTLRHGVSRVRSGRRFTLGVIFHDAA